MSVPTPGSSRGVLRHLGHLRPAPKGTAGKFANARVPRHSQPVPAFVQPRDRIAFWNIVPGDVVRLRKGKILGTDEQGRKLRGEGTVASIDRERNVVWIRNEENPHLNPTTGLKHLTPRLNDPEEGPTKGFSPNRAEIAKPVHYSNLILRLPESVQLPDELKKSHDLKAGIFASRLARSTAKFSGGKGMFVWTRYALVQDAEGNSHKIEVPWPKRQGRSRTAGPQHVSAGVVATESWLPWSPADPVHLPAGRQRTSPHSEARYLEIVGASQGSSDDVTDAGLNDARASPVEQEAEISPQKDVKDSGLSFPPRLGTYPGFEVRKSAKPPPVPQPPTPAELTWMKANARAEWAREEAVRTHTEEGGLSFAPSDYLDFAPAEAPGAGGDWSLPASSVTPSGDSPTFVTRRDPRDGRLVRGEGAKPSLMELDSYPIELLMAGELSNHHSLANRMRRWQEKRRTLKEESARKERERRANRAALRAAFKDA